MSNKARVSEFLGKAGVYYLTTVDGNKPKCRRFQGSLQADAG